MSQTKFEHLTDGVTHINIQSGHAQTPLGKALGMHTHHTWIHSDLGQFPTMENFWHYVKNGGDIEHLRDLPLKQLMVDLPAHSPVRVPNFRDIILDGFRQRILQDPALLALFKDNTLPFTAYRTQKFGPHQVTLENQGIRFVVDGLNAMRL